MVKKYFIYTRWSLPLLFLLVLAINYLSSAGIILSHTQQEISDKYLNLLTPSGFTFSIWAVIYLAVLFTLFDGWKRQEATPYYLIYQTQVKPLFVQWMLINIFWIIAWSEEWLLLSLILIAAYANILLKLIRIVSHDKILRSKKWVLKYPLGIHAGWIVFATFANLTTYAVSIGVDGVGKFAEWWTIILILIAFMIGSYLYAIYGNEALMIPIIWGIFGIAMKHQNNTDFLYASNMVRYAAWLILILAIGTYLYLTYLKKHQRK